MARGFNATYTTHSTRVTYTYTVSWDRRGGTVMWQANAHARGRIAGGLNGKLDDIPLDADPVPAIKAMIQQRLESLR